MKISNFLSKVELARVSKEVARAELLTSGEIVVVVSTKREKKFSPRERAIASFYRHNLDKTKDGTGVLILVLPRERKVEVVGDKGINERVPDGYWDGIVKMVVDGVKDGKPCDGICDAVTEVGRLLYEKFPRQPDDKNELSNEVILE